MAEDSAGRYVLVLNLDRGGDRRSSQENAFCVLDRVTEKGRVVSSLKWVSLNGVMTVHLRAVFVFVFLRRHACLRAPGELRTCNRLPGTHVQYLTTG